MKNEILITIGTNTDREKNMDLAVRCISDLPAQIVWGDTVATEPVDTKGKDSFLNKCALLRTDIGSRELKTAFKEVERLAGRTDEAVAAGIVALDIDIVVDNGNILKQDDWRRQYVRDFVRHLF